MKPHKSDTADTRTRLLDSAVTIFAEKGYRDATIAEICERAGANIAAVNYYFRDKETLYTEAWRESFQRSLAAHPADGGVSSDAPAEERFRGRIRSIIGRISDPESHEFEIVHKELANPTGLLGEVIHECIGPIREQMTLIVSELLGGKASQDLVFLTQMSAISQCMQIVGLRHMRRKMTKAPTPYPSVADMSVEKLADHIIRFSLGAIREIRRQLENGELTDTE